MKIARLYVLVGVGQRRATLGNIGQRFGNVGRRGAKGVNLDINYKFDCGHCRAIMGKNGRFRSICGNTPKANSTTNSDHILALLARLLHR